MYFISKFTFKLMKPVEIYKVHYYEIVLVSPLRSKILISEVFVTLTHLRDFQNATHLQNPNPKCCQTLTTHKYKLEIQV